jgi:drug/metabolite transporter (DMT)-like permease
VETNKHWLGFGLSLTTAFLWGILPIFIKLCLQTMDAMTITWYRFVVAGLFVFLVLWRKNALPKVYSLALRHKIWVSVASILLVLNYVSNVIGLSYLSPETTQVIMQVAPFLLMLGGVVFFGERLKLIEIMGTVLILLGLALFFSDKLERLFASLNHYSLGVIIIIFSATAWAGYALIQKPLLKVLSARQLTLCIYVIGALVLLPFTHLAQLNVLSVVQLVALLFCCINTIVAYGAFTEAMHVWQASKVSAVICLAPLFTFVSMTIAVYYFPNYIQASELDVWAYVGAGIVVCGSALTSLGRAKGIAPK